MNTKPQNKPTGPRPPKRAGSNRGPRPGMRPRVFSTKPIPHHDGGKPNTSPHLRVAVLGGNEEVGRNCTMIEYKNDIILIDMGLMFPQEDMPGVDYIIPNMSYLKGKEKNIRGVIITHGHYDHIGAIPHTVPMIGNPPIYALPMSAAIIKRRQTDFQTRPLDVRTVKLEDTIQLGALKVSFFHINHSIPDAAGIVIETPEGVICHSGDWKFDFHPTGVEHADFQRIAEIGRKGVMLLMGDSTNATKPGHQLSEKVIGEELERILEKAPGRVIVGTFASLLGRVKQLIESADKLGKKVALDGFSMKTNVEIAKELGFIKVPARAFIPIDQVDKYPPNKVLIICTGAQGEKNAALHRIANDEHRCLRIQPDDTIVFSSSVIPGNENSVQRLTDVLYRKRARVINYSMMDVHAGGHAQKEDIKLMLALMKPKYYAPIEGNHFLLRENANVAYSMGWTEQNVFVVDNGQIMEFTKGSGKMTKEKIPTDYVFVDGLGVGDVSQVVLRDRQLLAEDGMIVVIIQIDQHSGKIIGSPDIISRGFIFMKDQQELIDATRKQVQDALIDTSTASSMDPKEVKNKIRDKIGAFLFQKTERRPMIIPVIIEV